MKKLMSFMLTGFMLLSLMIATNAEGNTIAKDSSWKISATDNMAGSPPAFAFDGNPETMYHSFYKVNPDGTMSYERNNHAITVDFGKTINVSGFTYQARNDNKSGVMTAYAVYASTDGVNFKEIHTGTFNYGEDYTDTSLKTASWGNTEMRAIKLVSIEAYAGHFTAPEITFLEGTSGSKNGSGASYVPTGAEAEEAKKADKNNVSLDEVGGSIIEKDATWKFSATDNYRGMGPELAFDGNDKTYYHSFYEVTESGMNWQRNGHAITVDFGKKIMVSGWIYQRRTDDKSGTITGYEIYTSENGTDFTKIYTGAFNYGTDYSDLTAKIGSWGDTETRYIKIVSTEGYAGHATAVEISFLTGSKRVEETTEENQKSEELYTAENGVKSISRKGWKVSVNSDLNNGIANIIDGDTKSYWHSWYKASGTTVTEKDGLPYEIEVVLPKVETISGIIFIPRQDNQSGRFISTNVYASESDEGEYFLLTEGFATETNPDTKELLYNSNVKAKKIKIEVMAAYGTYGTLAELYILGENKDAATVSYEEFAENEKKHKMYAINKANMRASSETPSWSEHVPGQVLDGTTENFWQTEWVSEGTTISLKVDLGTVTEFSKISYLPRQTEDHHGLWKNVTIWVSEDGEDWKAAKENIAVEQTLGEHIFDLGGNVSARYVDFEITDFEASRASCAEINFWQDYETYLKYGAQGEKYTLKIDSNIIKVEKGKNSYEKQLDVAPYIVNGSTLIPLRGLLEEMGATVSWDGETQTVTLEKGALKLELQIWSKMVYAETAAYGRVRHTMLNFPVIKDSRTFIPIRFVSEQLGYTVSWDGETRTVTITTPEV